MDKNFYLISDWNTQLRMRQTILKTTFVIICLFANIQCIKQIREKSVYKLRGYNCNKPKSLVSYRKAEWCIPNTGTHHSGDDENIENVILAQKFVTQKLKAIKCTKKASRFLIYCGNYSHMKFFSPPSILEPEIMTTDECTDMYRRQAYISNEKTLRISTNQEIQFKEVIHGQIWSDEVNVYCIGAKFTLNGEQHEGMLELKTTQVTMSEVEIQMSRDTVTEILDNIELDRQCVVSMKCIIGTNTYIILEKPNLCNLEKIRNLELNKIRLKRKGIMTEYLVDKKHEIILRKTNKQRSEECDLVYFETDYPELVIITSMDDPKLSDLTAHPDSISLDLELRMTTEFSHYRVEMMIESTIHGIQKHLCMLGTESIQQMERSPIHPNALIRDRGDIIQEMECTQVEVTVNPGYKRHDKCSKDHLPVYLNEEPVYLDTSKLITKRPVFDLVECTEIFTPIFETIDGILIQATPAVQNIQLELTKPEEAGYHIDELGHIEETDSLLYTTKEMQAYQELFYAKKSRKALSYALTNRYCSSPGTCGEYQPTGSMGFDLSNLAQEAIHALDIWSWMSEQVQLYGSYASCFIILYLIVKFICMVANIILTRRKGVTWYTALRLNTLLLSEFRNNLIQNMPRQESDSVYPRSQNMELESHTT